MIIDLEAVRATDIPRVGGKGANLGELIAACPFRAASA